MGPLGIVLNEDRTVVSIAQNVEQRVDAAWRQQRRLAEVQRDQEKGTR